MTTLAGQMSNAAQPNPQWVPCDGKFYYVNDPKRTQRTPIPNSPSTGDRRNYLRRVGNQGRERGFGQLGFMIGVPYDPSGTWKVSLADDNTETTLSNPPTVGKPPAGVK